MLFKLVHQAFMVTIFITLLLSCGKSGSEDPISSGDGNQGGQNQEEQNVPVDSDLCVNARILKILDSGKNIISRLSSDRSQIIKWNVINGKKISSLNFPVNPYQISPDGKYIIRRINYKKYQLIKFVQNKGYFSRVITLNAAYSPMPSLEFSADSEYLVMKYSPFAQGGGQRIDIYSLEKEIFISTLNNRNISFAKITRDSKYYLVGFKKGYSTVIQKIEINTARVIFETQLNRYERIDHLYVGENVFIVRGNNGYHVYDTETGDSLYSKRLKQLFDIGSNGKKALVSEKWNEVKVMDLKTGEYIFSDKVPTGLILSSCQLLDSPLRVLCQDSINQGKVSIWDIEQGSSSTSCY